ncbi:alpha-amylase family glycosyl hydrolase [Lysobacter sp. M2-1]|uniref:alpha-amylase family glycosyl hydrolase n=1 Tax=Lysobacter sp. M2-1 TaxID=2916839 RepID=UPI001F5A3CAA|nr:alpha-amylase family glycosyl hydrolase [Lysobacter sp. M2-1]
MSAIARIGSAFALAGLLAAGYAPGASAQDAGASYRGRLPQDEVVYFVLPDRFANGSPDNDRGGIPGERLQHGFDPTHKGFYHGGDLAGLLSRLDYIQALGATAIWLGPIYKNKPVQGRPGRESSGYHGYWITDFTQVDPHFGTREEFKALVDALHARGMKIYLDIITNHTADVIKYRDCDADPCPYRALADYPYTRRGGIDGAPINDGFLGDDAAHQDAANFARLRDVDYAYQAYVPDGEQDSKTPAWLNELRYYHNRGDSTWKGESVTYGDFSGLDDLLTEHPRVVQGFIDIFGQWIDDFGIDGFRIDTARHVKPEFWQAFVPAMLARAKARGIPNFHIFGEVYDPDPGMLARFTRVDRYPAVLDFAFQSAVADAIAGKAGTDRLARLFFFDADYEGGAPAALQLPTFLGNHDMGRFAHFVREARPGVGEDELLKRVELAHALLFLARGVPVIYYGDEQGFAGDGGDQDARQDMFASQVASYNDDALVGSMQTTAVENFASDGPLFRTIARLAGLRRDDPALRRGEMRVRYAGDAPGLFAFSRLLDGAETLVAVNTGDKPVSAQVLVDAGSQRWESAAGSCTPTSSAPGSVRVELPPLSYSVCRAKP